MLMIMIIIFWKLESTTTNWIGCTLRRLTPEKIVFQLYLVGKNKSYEVMRNDVVVISP
jgi:hypothetical protein